VARRILVTGANGFIGGSILKFFSSDGTEVVGVSRHDCDLLDPDAIRLTLRQYKPDCIIHMAANQVGADDEPWKRVSEDCVMLSNVARAMPSYARLVMAGSMAEFGKSGHHDEQVICEPRTSYGFAKFAATNLAVKLRTQNSLDIFVLRLFGVYGPGESASRLFPQLVSKLVAGHTVPLSDGQQIRDFVHVYDVYRVFRIISMMSDVPPYAILNVGSGIGITVKDVCLKVAHKLGQPEHLLDFGRIERRSVDEGELVANTERLSSLAPVPPQRWLHDDGLTMDYISLLAGKF
jgi:nucleoside-diphosphate-sugar epimerase